MTLSFARHEEALFSKFANTIRHIAVSISLIPSSIFFFYKVCNTSRRASLSCVYTCKGRATRCDFCPQVSADDSAEEADHIEKNIAASMRSAAIFLHTFLRSMDYMSM